MSDGRNVWQMEAFDGAWPNLQTSSVDSGEPDILPTPSAESQTRSLPLLFLGDRSAARWLDHATESPPVRLAVLQAHGPVPRQSGDAVRDLKSFLLEPGSDFSFVGWQKRLRVELERRLQPRLKENP